MLYFRCKEAIYVLNILQSRCFRERVRVCNPASEYSTAAVKHFPAEMSLGVGAFSWSWGC